MSDDTARAGLPVIPVTVDQPAILHNEALLQLDGLLCARFLDRDLTAPPASPADGDTYLVKATATGDWSGQDGKIAYAVDGAWRFYAPFAGLTAYVVDEACAVVFDGAAWADYASILNLANVPLLGVNTTADATNKLAAKSSAVLFDNIGGGIQAKLNKHAAGDTASLLYQTNYSGRAEIGLCGDDDFHFKVSPDGSTWYDGLDINRADGSVDFLASESSLASAATVDLGSASSLEVNVTGTTTISSFGTARNALRYVRFSAALTLTHNASSLILLGGATRVTAAGDVGLYTSDASGNWRERAYARAASDAGDIATKSGSETFANKTLASATLSGATTLPGGGQIGSGGAVGIGIAPSTFGQLVISNSGALGLEVVPGDPSGCLLRAYDRSASAFGDLVFQGNSVKYGGSITPTADNVLNVGSATLRWAQVYAAAATINTSGADTKLDVRALTGAERAVARALAGNVRMFRFTDAVARKAEGARLHAGMIYEDVVAAFAAQGLDPMRYGIVCRDPAPDSTADAPSWVYGLRYGELAQFLIAGLADRIAALETR